MHSGILAVLGLSFAYALAGHGHQGYFQYANVPGWGQYEFGFHRGNPGHYISRYEQGHGWRARTKVRWGDKKGGYGEHYFDYNHHDKGQKGGHHHQEKGHHHEKPHHHEEQHKGWGWPSQGQHGHHEQKTQHTHHEPHGHHGHPGGNFGSFSENVPQFTYAANRNANVMRPVNERARRVVSTQHPNHRY